MIDFVASFIAGTFAGMIILLCILLVVGLMFFFMSQAIYLFGLWPVSVFLVMSMFIGLIIAISGKRV